MIIHTEFYGILADFMGAKKTAFTLPEGARYRDLLAAIGRRYHENMPKQLWDAQQNGFVAPVLAVSERKTFTDPDARLREGEILTFYLMLAGG